MKNYQNLKAYTMLSKSLSKYCDRLFKPTIGPALMTPIVFHTPASPTIG